MININIYSGNKATVEPGAALTVENNAEYSVSDAYTALAEMVHIKNGKDLINFENCKDDSVFEMLSDLKKMEFINYEVTGGIVDYQTETGTLDTLINNSKVSLTNNYGDGDFQLYILNDYTEKIPYKVSPRGVIDSKEFYTAGQEFGGRWSVWAIKSINSGDMVIKAMNTNSQWFYKKYR